MKNNFKNIFPVLSLFLLLSLFATMSPHNAFGYSGPVGLNQVITESGPSTGQVTLHWVRYAPNVDSYSIWYGTSPGKYQYAAASIGNNVVYTVGYLQPGVRYYFLIQGYSQGQALPLVSPEVSEIAASGQNTIVSTAGPYGQRLLSATSGPKSGEVTLAWRSISSDTSNFSIVYGVQTGKYIYGALNIAPNTKFGQWEKYVVDSLASGTRYYFAVVPMRGGQGIYSSGEVSQVAP